MTNPTANLFFGQQISEFVRSVIKKRMKETDEGVVGPSDLIGLLLASQSMVCVALMHHDGEVARCPNSTLTVSQWSIGHECQLVGTVWLVPFPTLIRTPLSLSWL